MILCCPVLSPSVCSADPVSSTGAKIFDCKPGPWGKVQWHYLYLEAPDWILESYAAPNSQPTWSFPGAKADALRKFLSEAGIAPEIAERWFAERRTIVEGPEAITLFPSAADIEGLSAKTRGIVYPELAKSPKNELYVNPVKILDRDVDEWLGRREVRPEIRDLLKRLTYLQGSVLCFSDLPVLFSHARDDREVQDFTKLYSRTRAIMAYVQVQEDDNTQALVKYWSGGFRHKDVLPMLNSVSMLPGGGRLGLSHLIPSEPRKLIYTYPTLDMAVTGRMPDCHWTTLNFFNHRPKDILLDLRLVASRVLQGYEKVEPPYQYGDALFFLDQNNQGVHSCTYLCDDLVFTKNGEPLTAPWMISRIGDLERMYSYRSPTQIQGFRQRWEPTR